MQEYVGIDLHRRRLVIVRMNEAGEVLQEARVESDPVALSLAIAEAGPDPEVAIEATYGWYWAADVLKTAGAKVHLAHPLGMKVFEHQRVKRDNTDARNLADLLRMDRLPQGWIAPPALRELRELVRYRAKLVALRSGLKAQVHSVLAKEGVRVAMSDLFGEAGGELLDSLRLGRAYELRVASLRSLIEIYDEEIHTLNLEIYPQLKDHRGFQAIQAIPGVGPVLGAVFVAEIGDVRRFPDAAHLCSWSGLTPTHRQSDTTVRRGHVTKQGSKLVRWAAVEAVARLRPGTKQYDDWRRISARRGRMVGRVAEARKVLTLVYYGLRDGTIRCLASPRKEAA